MSYLVVGQLLTGYPSNARSIHKQLFFILYLIDIIYNNAPEYPWKLQWKQCKITKKKPLVNSSIDYVFKDIKVIKLLKTNKNTKISMSSKH
jgi:hypothetical protein